MERKPAKAVAAAISAAVLSYIKLQEQASKPEVAVALPSVSAATTSLYSVSGRQQMMEMRRLLSLRVGRR